MKFEFAIVDCLVEKDGKFLLKGKADQAGRGYITYQAVT